MTLFQKLKVKKIKSEKRLLGVPILTADLKHKCWAFLMRGLFELGHWQPLPLNPLLVIRNPNMAWATTTSWVYNFNSNSLISR